MTRLELLTTVETMKRFGGSFVKAFAQTLFLADEVNKERLTDAFPELIAQYGPGSTPYYKMTGIESIKD